MEAITLHQEISDKAKSTLKKAVTITEMAVGQFIRQGDVYIRMIDGITGTKQIEKYQLAPGTTKGSRHIVDSSVKLYEGFDRSDVREEVKGPQIEAKSVFEVSHPEHANFILPAGCYQVSYQYDWERQSRVRD